MLQKPPGQLLVMPHNIDDDDDNDDDDDSSVKAAYPFREVTP
jgi:hypothetical protein